MDKNEQEAKKNEEQKDDAISKQLAEFYRNQKKLYPVKGSLCGTTKKPPRPVKG